MLLIVRVVHNNNAHERLSDHFRPCCRYRRTNRGETKPNSLVCNVAAREPMFAMSGQLGLQSTR